MTKLIAGTKDPYVDTAQPVTLLDFQECEANGVSGLQILEDRQIRHRLSPGGPEHGISTYSKDLQNQLNLLSANAEADKWWSENPHWHEGL